MKKQKKHIIEKVEKNSIGEEVGIEAGDYILTVNGQEVEDILDYHYLVTNEYVEIEIEKKSTGDTWILEIEKEEEEDIGLGFPSSLMDEYKSCNNKCMFCFIDQLPKGMRETLYFKDDDSRLSFLQGNYVTLTNMKEHDIDRIIKYHLSPINISVHTMNMELRKKMLNNRFADNINHFIEKLYNAHIWMNGQIVLCKGVNDGDELNQTIEALSEYLPYMQSVSIVPVGLSKFRDGLYPLEPFTKEDSIKIIEMVHEWQEKLYGKHQMHFIHLSDEFYFLAEREVPHKDTYDDYLQLENGVGMTRLLLDTFDDNIKETYLDYHKGKISIATATMMGPLIKKMMDKLMEKYNNIHIAVYPIVNNFFGKNITVSGLLTGSDIIEQLKGKELGEQLLLPSNLLKDGEEILLDDVTLQEIEEALDTKIVIVDQNGKDLVQRILFH